MTLRNLTILISIFLLTACGMTRWYTDYGIPSKQDVINAQYVPNLINALGDDDRRTLISAAKALERVDPAAVSSLPALAKVANSDHHLKARIQAIHAMVVIDKENPLTIDTLSELMIHGRPGKIRVAAARAFTSYGPAAAPAVRVLAEALENRYAKVRNYAAKALANIGPQAKYALPALERTAAGDERRAIQASAKEAIRLITYEARN